MAIRLTTHDLAKRGKNVISLISPLVGNLGRVEARRLPSKRDFVLGVLPHGLSPTDVNAPDQLRVPSLQAGIYFNYYEIWMPVGTGESYALERAYLHLYIKRDLQDQELQALSLHCDPLLAKSEPSYAYKRGPHLHVGGATPSIDRAHLSLCVGDASLGGNNVGSLMAKLRQSIDMVASELLPCYQ